MKPLQATLLIGILLLVVSMPYVFIARARVMKADSMRIHLIQDMDNQIKYKAQQVNSAFADGRAMRLPVAGTVAQGMLNEDTHLNQGKVNGEFTNEFPIKVTEAIIKRGQERFAIFCAPCHGLTGDGTGMVTQRAEQLQEGTWTLPLSFHSETVLKRPVGHIFNTITNGIRNMPAYGDQINVDDRWAIIAYLRALQRSQMASMDDVPTEKQEALKQELQ